MTTARVPITIKLDELNDVVDAVPFLLGFQPKESIVAVTLQNPRERLSFSMRLDLVEPEHDDTFAAFVAERMAATKEAVAVMLFIYTDERPCNGRLPRQELVDRIATALTLPLRDAVLVHEDRIWSYVCDDPRCCPLDGRVRDASSPGRRALEAAHALNGTVVLPDREAVVASIQRVAGERARAMDAALEAAGVEFADSTPRDYRQRAKRLAVKLRARYTDRPGDLTDAEAATLILALHDVLLRDELIGWAASGDEDVMRLLFTDLARRALPPLDAPACTALAWTAYLQGDGVIVSTALERALESDPDYSLAQLLTTALHGQLHPAELRRAFTPLTATGT